MATRDELAYITASELAARIRRRDLSPVEVLDAVLERIHVRNASLNALVYLNEDEARDRARAAERALLAGEDVGPLHGVPTAMKDCFDFKPGWPATLGGVPALKDYSPDAYCTFALRMEQAGAIIVGKTNSPALGFRGVTDNYLFGPTRNPFDTTRNPGGSSGGAAAAVADGLLPFAEGTDGGGSIRIPASWCGLYGYKASYGRVPAIARPNAFGSTAPFTHEGALTRTVQDSALTLDVLAGRHPADPFSLDDPQDFSAATSRSIEGWRIAYSPALDVYPVDPRVAGVVADAVCAFEEAGAHVEEVDLGITRDQRELSDLWARMIIPLSVGAIEGLRAQGYDFRGELAGDLPPEIHEWLDVGYGLSVLDLARDQEMRTEVYEAIEGTLGRYDLLISPTVGALPVVNGDDRNTVGPREINGVEVDPLIGWCLTYLTNFTGHPAASIPAGMVDGLPVGMQIVGRRYADADVLAASAAFERLRPWQQAYDRCAARTL
jgi:amidase